PERRRGGRRAGPVGQHGQARRAPRPGVAVPAPGRARGGPMTAQGRERMWEVFDRAAGLPPGERAAVLDGACAGDPELRAEVEGLLAHDVESTCEGGILGGLLVRRSRGPDPTPPEPHSVDAPAAPARVGRYRVVRLLGEGGMGTVY